jgi:hypothetical protein
MLMSARARLLFRSAIRPNLVPPRNQSEQGVSMVEFAIVITLLFLLVFGIIQFGFAFNRDQGLHAAAREGARVAAVGGTQDEAADRVREAQSLFNENDVKIKIDYSTDDGGSYPGGNLICDDAGGTHCTDHLDPVCTGKIGNLIRVTATVPAGAGSGRYAIIIPFWGNVNITFSSQGVFRCEQQ